MKYVKNPARLLNRAYVNKRNTAKSYTGAQKYLHPYLTNIIEMRVSLMGINTSKVLLETMSIVDIGSV